MKRQGFDAKAAGGVDHTGGDPASNGSVVPGPPHGWGQQSAASYYNQPILNPPAWKVPDIPGYLFLGGMAGSASLLAAGSELTSRPSLARWSRLASAGAMGMSLVALVNDLGRPSRFLNMLRTFKPTSPMSVGSWILSAYAPAAMLGAVTDFVALPPPIRAAATAGTVLLGPPLATYTAALISNTAVPSWHAAYRELPFLFASSGAAAAGGLGMAAAPLSENSPARRLGILGAVGELVCEELISRRLGFLHTPYREGRGGAYMKASKVLAVAGSALALVGAGRSRAAGVLSGMCLVSASLATRWGVFHAGKQSAEDPRYTVEPQRARLQAQGRD